MKPNKAFRKFGRACMHAPPDAEFTVGVAWIEKNGWRVMMAVHTAILHLGAAEARGLADIYDRYHGSPEWRGKTTGLEWVAAELRKLAGEIDEKNAAGVVPPEMLGHISTLGSA